MDLECGCVYISESQRSPIGYESLENTNQFQITELHFLFFFKTLIFSTLYEIIHL